MNTQILIPLDDMTPENGATSLRPRSQIEIEYPTDVGEYRSKESFRDLVCKLFHLNLELNYTLLSGTNFNCYVSSPHRTPNITNPEFQFPQFKVFRKCCVFFSF